MRQIDCIVTESQNGKKLEKLLLNDMLLSFGNVRKLKYRNAILLDGKPSHTNIRVKTGQRVSVVYEDMNICSLIPYALPLNIVYEDDDLLIIDKPAPLASISSCRGDTMTLENAVYHYLGCPEAFVYRPVNRLDKGTSGLMLVARNVYIQQRMQRVLHSESFERDYVCLTDGCPEKKDGAVSEPILETGEPCRRIDPSGKPCVTQYHVLQTDGKHALIALRLKTGRTHQIRVHMQSLGCPVTGDYLYGTEHPLFPGRFALHSGHLSFVHPMTGRKLSFESEAPFSLGMDGL